MFLAWVVLVWSTEHIGARTHHSDLIHLIRKAWAGSNNPLFTLPIRSDRILLYSSAFFLSWSGRLRPGGLFFISLHQWSAGICLLDTFSSSFSLSVFAGGTK